jgi:NADH:ubiquinone oxidoreductase subunit 2 (subunit N)
MIYGFTGHTGFEAIAAAVAKQTETPIGLIVGIAFLTAAGSVGLAREAASSGSGCGAIRTSR